MHQQQMPHWHMTPSRAFHGPLSLSGGPGDECCFHDAAVAVANAAAVSSAAVAADVAAAVLALAAVLAAAVVAEYQY